jgi:hypothetical protein
LFWDDLNVIDVIGYNIYRENNLVGSSTITSFTEEGLEQNTEYCYVVTAFTEFNESDFSSSACAITTEIDLEEPMELTAYADGLTVYLNWLTPGIGCADEAIPSLPFNTIGSNVGEGDEWLVQGSQGADYAYLLNISESIVIDVTLCSMETNYDTKLEIFTADQECIETTTGYYIDDDYENCPEYVAPYPPSGLWGVYLEPGEYFIVVDGFGGNVGNYEIFVSQSGLSAHDDTTPILDDYLEENVSYESEKSNENISLEDWNIAFNQNLNSYNFD